MNRPILIVPVPKVEGDSSAPFRDLSAVEEPLNPRQVGNSVTVDLNPEIEVDLDRLERHFYTTSSCGVLIVESRVIHCLPDALRRALQTGGGNRAALQLDPARVRARQPF